MHTDTSLSPTVPTPAQAAPVTPREKRARQKAEQRRQAAARAFVLKPVSRTLAFAGALMAISSALVVASFVLIVEACRALLDGRTNDAWPFVFFALGCLGLRGLLSSGALLWTHVADAANQYELRRAIADKLTRVPLGWFSERSSGDVKKALQDDVDALHVLVAHARLEFIAAITVPALSLGYLFFVDWRLALVLVVPLFGYSIALGMMMGRDYAAGMAAYEEWGRKAEAATIEFVDGIQVVRTFGQARRAHHRFQRAVDGFSEFFAAWATPMTRTEALAGVLLNPVFMLGLILVFGLWLIGAGSMDPLTLVPFILVGIGLGATVLTVGYGVQALRQADAAAIRLHALHQETELIVSEAAPVGDSTVAFTDVRFSYDGTREVLRGVNLTLEPGTITALVGPSGSGKSTLARLLPRFADVDGGAITLGGVDLRSIASDELYRHVGFVFQDVRLLRDTVRANIALARPDATDDDIVRAATAARIHDRILELPGGYDAIVGIDARLSGGEAQRLSIARALLADTPVLVLDEATAFADPESEAAIQDALATLIADRTVLLIAHRLRTITGVERIVVLEDGQIVEAGTHDDLFAAEGTYRSLWDANERALGDLAVIEDLDDVEAAR